MNAEETARLILNHDQNIPKDWTWEEADSGKHYISAGGKRLFSRLKGAFPADLMFVIMCRRDAPTLARAYLELAEAVKAYEETRHGGKTAVTMTDVEAKMYRIVKGNS